MPKIKSISFGGIQETYDIEVDHPDHQFFLASGILTSNSHAISYAIDSYYSAWLHTYYEKEWLATCLQTQTGTDKFGKVIAEIKSLGYKILPPDINISSDVWVFSKERNGFIPPLTALKGVGNSAIQEILENRPYETLSDLLYKPDGEWRHSKFNKKAFEALCQVDAFASIEEMWNGTISNHAQLYAIILGNYDILRKSKWGMTAKKAQKTGASPILPRLIDEVQDIPDWTRAQKLEMYKALTDSVRDELAFPDDLMRKLKNTGIDSFALLEKGKSGLGWFMVVSSEKKITKNKKVYHRVVIMDDECNVANLQVWGDITFTPYTLWLSDLKRDPQWGYSTFINKLEKFDI